MGIDQNIISSMSVNDTSGESGILTIILDIGIDLTDELQVLVNIDSNPLTNSTILLIQSNVNSSIALNK